MTHPENDAPPLAGEGGVKDVDSLMHDTRLPAAIDAELLRRFRAKQDVAATSRIIRAEQAGEALEARWLRCERAKARARGRCGR